MKALLLALPLWFTSLFSAPPPTVTPPVVPSHPYAISNLATKVDPNSTITTTKTYSRHASFASFEVSYLSEGLTQNALMNVPTGDPPAGGWPVIIVNHGHIPSNLYSTRNSYINTSAYYASRGFLVLKPDYRGHAQSAGESDRLIARSQYAVDVLNLLKAIDTLPNVNQNRIYLYGHSMGGDINLQILETTTRIKAASLWAPAVTTYPESVIFFIKKDKLNSTELSGWESRLRQFIITNDPVMFSPLTYLDQISTPIIVHHSPTDPIVPYSWGQHLVDRLSGLNKNITFYSYPNDNHDLARNWSTALSRDVEFFNQNL